MKCPYCEETEMYFLVSGNIHEGELLDEDTYYCPACHASEPVDYEEWKVKPQRNE